MMDDLRLLRILTMGLLLLIASLLIGILVADAQPTALSVNIKTARFVWAWNQTVEGVTGGMADYFQVQCTPSSGDPIVGPRTTAEARSQLILSVVPAVGAYSCVVVAGNVFGNSPPSNVVMFEAGDIPLPASGLEVVGGTP